MKSSRVQSIVARTACVVAICVATVTSSVEAKTILTLAYGLPEETSYGMGSATFKKLVEEGSKGEIEVRIICCARMGSDEDMFKRLQLGTLDAAVISVNNAGPFFPPIDTIHLPYMFQSKGHMERVMLGPIGDEMSENMAKDTGVVTLGYTDLMFRNIYNTKRDISSLKDIQGLKYRVPNNAVMIKTYQAFGANPTPLGYAQTFSATQTGMVDGGDLAVVHYYQSKMYEIAKHMAFTEHFPLISAIVVSRQFLAKLSPEQQALVHKAGVAGGLAGREFDAETERAALTQMKTQGVTFTSPDKAPFIAAAKKVWDDFARERGPETSALIQKIATEANK